jgi:hypothetical protein
MGVANLGYLSATPIMLARIMDVEEAKGNMCVVSALTGQGKKKRRIRGARLNR